MDPNHKFPLESDSAEKKSETSVTLPVAIEYFMKVSVFGSNLAIIFPKTPTHINPSASSAIAEQ